MSDIAVDLALCPPEIRRAVENMYVALEADPWAFEPAVPSDPGAALRRQPIVAEGQRWELWILVVDRALRVDLIRLRRWAEPR